MPSFRRSFGARLCLKSFLPHPSLIIWFSLPNLIASRSRFSRISMAFMLRAFTNSLRRTRPSPRELSSSVAHCLPTETPIEEETLPYYQPSHYYPVKIGDVYHTRYEVAGKLGYGAYSTSWLCRDLQCATIPPFSNLRRSSLTPYLWTKSQQ